MCKVSGADDYDDDVMLVVVLAKEERNIGKGDGERGEGGRIQLGTSASKPNKKIDTSTPMKDMKLATTFTLLLNPL